MSVEAFLDTGILVAAVSSARTEADRKRTALELIQQLDFGLSARVLEEFYVAVTERIRRPLSPEVAVALLDEYRVFPVVPTDYALVATTAELSLRHRLAFRDAAAVAAAGALDAPVLITDALPDGARYDGVRVLNPFPPAQGQVLDRSLRTYL
ncbi:MAG: PIN domain-containing protein [Vicinamibacterales bacterium]